MCWQLGIDEKDLADVAARAMRRADNEASLFVRIGTAQTKVKPDPSIVRYVQH